MKKFKLILIGTIAAISLIGLQSCKDKEVEVTGITLNKTNITLEVGSSETIKAVVTPEDATDKEVKWASSNDKIATVKGGKVTAVAEGTAIITATAGNEEATCVVKVGAKEKIRYKLGDYYPDPNSSSTAVGMVFWIDPSAEGYDATDNSGFSGKVIHKDRINSIAWGPEELISNASSRTDGMVNLEAIKQHANWGNNYPAFKWCADKGNQWYLPAIEELTQLYCGVNGIYPAVTWAGSNCPTGNVSVWEAFDAKMEAAGGDATNYNSGYWSSTEHELEMNIADFSYDMVMYIYSGEARGALGVDRKEDLAQGAIAIRKF